MNKKEECMSVEDRLIRMGLKPRTKDELRIIEVGTVDRFSSGLCGECKQSMHPSSIFKPEESNSVYRIWTCPTCGTQYYQEVKSRGFSRDRLIYKFTGLSVVEQTEREELMGMSSYFTIY